MDYLIQTGIIVIAIAGIILMYAIVQTLKVLKGAIEELRLMIGQVRTDVSHISEDMKEAIHNTNAMTLDVREKLSSLNVIFSIVNDVGQAVHSFTDVAKHSASQLAATMEDSHRPSSQESHSTAKVSSAVIDGIISALRIWKKLRP